MRFLFLILLFSFWNTSNAQNIDVINDQLKSAGISKDQFEDLVKVNSNSIPDNNINNEVIIESDDFEKTINQEQSQLLDTLYNNEYYFGYKIFTGDPEAFQASTFGSVDPNYNIGPGDQIIVMLWGESQFRQEYTINREGYVFINEVGQVYVNGLDLEALEKKLFQIFSKVYSTLKPSIGKPTTFMDISLGSLRPLRIIVLGEVSQPGAYSVSPSTSLSSSLYYFSGPTIDGSLRNIKLIRKGDVLGNIDFYDYLLSGNIPNDIRLQLDDIVFVPPRGKTINIYGEINRQGFYELKDEEGLIELIKYAGGLLPTTYMKRAQISRIVPFDKRDQIKMDRMIIDIDLQKIYFDNKNIFLSDGDEIELFRITDNKTNFVSIIGETVARPGNYELKPKMKLKDLLILSDGIFSSVYEYNISLIRINDNFLEDIYSFNLNDILNDSIDSNVYLKSMDKIIIYDQSFIKNQSKNVIIDGVVKNPGLYNLENNKTLGDIILASGGFIKNINRVRISVARSVAGDYMPRFYYFPNKSKNFITIEDLEDSESELNIFELLSNDIINIYGDPNDAIPDIVKISGSINYPGHYPIKSSSEKVSSIIKRAGGLLPNAYPMGSMLYRDNKSIRLSFDKIIKNHNSKENFTIIAGDSIFISTKPNIVQVLGEVNNPGYYKYFSNTSLNKYIDIAGGLNKDAEKKEIWISYPDGTNKKNRLLFSPIVYDGSVINVGTKDTTDPINPTELTAEIASIFSDLLQVILLYNAIK